VLTAAIVSGILLGSIYALMAAGLNLIFGVIKVINFAHGALLMLGMYLSYWLWVAGFDPYIGLPIVVAAMAVIGWLIQVVFINPVLRSERTSQLLITFGLALVVQNGAVILWQHDYRSITTAYGRTLLEFAGLRFTLTTAIAVLGAATALALLYLFLHHTRFGTAIRAVSQQPDSAELAGINVKRMYAAAFSIGTALVGVAAVLMAPIYFVQPEIGNEFGIMAFIIVILGGLGNVFGAALAGLALGIVQNLFATFVSVEMSTAIVFLFFIILMLFRPYGVFGRTARLA
jgi:branched-chain amino acid transport system permease protein